MRGKKCDQFALNGDKHNPTINKRRHRGLCRDDLERVCCWSYTEEEPINWIINSLAPLLKWWPPYVMTQLGDDAKLECGGRFTNPPPQPRPSSRKAAINSLQCTFNSGRHNRGCIFFLSFQWSGRKAFWNGNSQWHGQETNPKKLVMAAGGGGRGC